ncbi:ABC transporter ATP-binding protein [Mesorhizobium sp. WSM4303]|uniref:ABC transporter ATP-binding protein n=1 Tax=unclassified Mesorhizobium TaxID=325217 RepID=UPI00115D3845|nr:MULTISPECIES: ABC transporter ATP-binding protein [unclassified Mesorhizobium]TRC96518.1 ABC transporter ATP-binding protein [Mesorhizobium sp. WSM4306]TRC96647.1 ABC transporter ATP-binding protein [Mesorhizobium sp. WSM4303]
MAIVFDGVTKAFPDGTVALQALDLAFEPGEFLVLLGPSGSGKTTACRLLAGLERPTAGRIMVEGRDVTDLPPRLRGMGMVFQNYALYSHKSVYENIAYPLRIRKMPAAELDRCVRAMAGLLEITRYLDRRPSQLSGGQAQRVAVARALVWQPSLCLMDEPLSNLDALLRLHMRTELKRLHRELKKTFVFVTHDQEEAMTLATRVAVLREGALIQYDDPREIYRRPANRFIAEFIGRPAMNTFDGDVRNGVFHANGFSCPLPGKPDGPIVLGIRPEQIQLVDASAGDAIRFAIDVVEPVEPDVLIFAKSEANALIVRTVNDDRAYDPGQPLHLRFPPAALHVFDAMSGARLP